MPVKLGVAAAVVDGSLVRGDVEIENGTIVAVGLAGGRSGIAIPGLVDLQVNGFRGIDLLHATGDEVEKLGVELARTGVLWYQPTLITAPAELTRLALSTIGECAAAPPADAARRGFSAPTSRGRSSVPSARARILRSTSGSPTSISSPRTSSPARR